MKRALFLVLLLCFPVYSFGRVRDCEPYKSDMLQNEGHTDALKNINPDLALHSQTRSSISELEYDLCLTLNVVDGQTEKLKTHEAIINLLIDRISAIEKQKSVIKSPLNNAAIK